jgi:hypothetical protein
LLVEQRHAASDPTTAAMVHRSAAALSDGRTDEAERLARRAIDRDGAYVPARLALGRALEAVGLHAEAAAVYAEAARMSPFSAGVGSSLRRVWVAPLAGVGIVAFVVWSVFRVVTRQFDQRTVLAGLLVSTAVLIVGSLFILARRRRVFAELSEADRRLLEAHGGGFAGFGPASGKLVSIGGVIVLLSASAIVFAVGTKPSLQLKIGDCFSTEWNKTFQSVASIPCELPHGLEVYAMVQDPAPPGAPYPGMDAIQAAARHGCEAAYEPFVGAPYTTTSKYWMTILSPEEPYWVLDIRTNWCAVYPRKEAQSSGSASGSRQ